MDKYKASVFVRTFAAVHFYFKLLGFRDGIWFALSLIYSGKETIYCSGLKKLNIENSSVPSGGLSFRLIETAQQYDEIISDYAHVKGPVLSKLDRNRIVNGTELLALIYDGKEFAGWGWVYKGPLRYGNIRVSNDDCVIHKCRTLPEHRGKGVYFNLLLNLKFTLAKRGFEKVYIGAKSFNQASLSGIEKAGFDFVEECDLGAFPARLFHHLRGKGSKVLRGGG